jgi:hypothetical protein
MDESTVKEWLLECGYFRFSKFSLPRIYRNPLKRLFRNRIVKSLRNEKFAYIHPGNHLADMIDESHGKGPLLIYGYSDLLDNEDTVKAIHYKLFDTVYDGMEYKEFEKLGIWHRAIAIMRKPRLDSLEKKVMGGSLLRMVSTDQDITEPYIVVGRIGVWNGKECGPKQVMRFAKHFSDEIKEGNEYLC